ncbi:hypothetical protein [Kineosporia succinea]|uniref:Uncharacterized protein n=1 Tax=Kineosporia succinea TaxID=84632 RepID=A0ABT9PAB3_9ACTN|nr:hypothetical protein [Kineosporia succinea]MDP9829364.1 hypothetical protein [Kineosporia succinea]
MSDDRMRYRVAVVVFADVRGVDYVDATAGAVQAIRSALTDGFTKPVPVDLPNPYASEERFKDHDMSCRAVAVMDLGMAAGNGYLWTEPTARAWTNYGNDLPDIARRTWKVEEPEPDEEEVPGE